MARRSKERQGKERLTFALPALSAFMQIWVQKCLVESIDHPCSQNNQKVPGHRQGKNWPPSIRKQLAVKVVSEQLADGTHCRTSTY